MKLICINNEGCIVNGFYYNVKLEYEVNTMDDFELLHKQVVAVTWKASTKQR